MAIHFGELEVDEKFKVRPYRLGEVAWDLTPVLAIPILFLALFGDLINDRFEWMVALLLLAFITPIGAPCWMHLSTGRTLRRIARTEWREAIYLSGTAAREYILSELRPRMIVQFIPIALGIPLFGAFWWQAAKLDLGEDPLYSFEEELAGMATLYVTASLYFCGAGVGYWGLADRLRATCRNGGSGQREGLVLMKWLSVTLFTPMIIIAGTIYLTFSALVETDGDAMLYSSIYLVAVFSYLNWIVYRGTRRAWRKLSDKYFQFE